MEFQQCREGFQFDRLIGMIQQVIQIRGDFLIADFPGENYQIADIGRSRVMDSLFDLVARLFIEMGEQVNQVGTQVGIFIFRIQIDRLGDDSGSKKNQEVQRIHIFLLAEFVECIDRPGNKKRAFNFFQANSCRGPQFGIGFVDGVQLEGIKNLF